MKQIDQREVAAGIAKASTAITDAASAFNRLRGIAVITSLSIREIGQAFRAHKKRRANARASNPSA